MDGFCQVNTWRVYYLTASLYSLGVISSNSLEPGKEEYSRYKNSSPHNWLPKRVAMDQTYT